MYMAISHQCLLTWHLALLAILSFITNAISATTEAAPMVIDPSQYWEGNDGPWSTFFMQVGHSKNVTRVLVSTAIPEQWVVLEGACSTTACATSRGGSLFDPNKSSTWNNSGIFNLYYESNLGLGNGENGDYGLDTIGIGMDPTNTSTVEDAVVVGIFAQDFWLGYLGINPQVTNLQNYATAFPSLIQKLNTSRAIPSLSYSYTAGAQYRNKGVFGGLILGGYDTSRYQPNSIDFNMAGDISRDLVVGVQSLQSVEASGKTTNLLNEGILAYIDSTVPWIILPNAACNTIEQTFDISQDNTTGLYLISDSQHDALTLRNPNFTFFLGNDAAGGSTVPITLPYASFDLQVSAPYVNTSSRYFPLKCGNSSTYTLGRTFLQESYLIADYERSTFTVSQTLFNQGDTQSIKPIHALGYVASNDTSSGSTSSDSGSGITTGAIVGIVIAVVVILIAIATLLILRHQRRWPFHNRYESTNATELDSDRNILMHEKDGVAAAGRRHPSNRKNTAFGQTALAEADSKTNLHGFYRPELAGADGTLYKSELSDGRPANRRGLPGNATSRNELVGSHGATEVEGSTDFAMELPGSPVGNQYFRRPEESSRNSTSKAGLSPRSPLAGSRGLSGSTAGHSPISPRRGSDLSPNIDQSGLGRASPATSRESRTPVSPPTPRSRHPVEHSNLDGSF